jgi:hypothetical protein
MLRRSIIQELESIRPRLVVVAACFALVAAGCASRDDETATAGAPSTTATTAPEPVGGLIASIGTNRLYALDRGFGLRLQNVGIEPVIVRHLQLDSPLFETVEPTDEEVLLPAQHRGYVLPLPYGEARCRGEPPPAFDAVVVLDGGEELRVHATEEDPGAIGRLHERECAAAEVRALVDLRWGDDWVTESNEAVRGELVLEQRRAGAAVAVEDAAGSVIFTVLPEAGGPPILRVDDDQPTAAVPVVISADRCDPHALAESKRTFAFVAWVAVGDAEAVPVDVEPTGPARAALEGLLSTCAG